MTVLPARGNILQECLEVCALAQAKFVSSSNFDTLPYLKHVLDSDAETLLLEKLLALAVKARFLDDRLGILREGDRRLLTIGSYFENGVANDASVCIREALNKLVHHRSLRVNVEESTCIVVDAPGGVSERRILPSGAHRRASVIVAVEGERSGKPWLFEINLFTLLNELARVLDGLDH